MLCPGTRRVLLLLAILITVPALGLLALALRRRLPPAMVPGALMILPAEAGGLVGAAQAHALGAALIAGAGLAAAVGAVLQAAATASTQLAPWWFHRFEAELARWEAGAAAPRDVSRP
jgi:hypothetical protein